MPKRADRARLQGGTNHDERGPTKKNATPAPGTLMRLQQTAGNQATVALLEAGQAKLAVGPVGDRYEREADQIATAVLSASEGWERLWRSSHRGRPGGR